MKRWDHRLMLPRPFTAYLLFDDFQTATTSLDSPRACEPGPGSWAVVDTGGHLSVSEGWFVANGMTAWGDPSLWAGPFDQENLGGVVAHVYRQGTTTLGPALITHSESGAINPLTTGYGLLVDNYELRRAGSGALLIKYPVERLRSVYYALVIVRLPDGASVLALSGGDWGTWPQATVLYVETEQRDDLHYIGWEQGGGQSRTDRIQIVPRSLLTPPLRTRFGTALAGDAFDGTGNLHGRQPDQGNSWDVWTGSMLVENGGARAADAGFSRARLDCGQAPRVIAMRVTTPAQTANREVYLDFRDSGTARLSLAMDTNSTYLYSSYSSASLASNPAPLPEGSTFHLVIVDDGKVIRVYRDGVLLIDTTTSDGSGQARCGFTVNAVDVVIESFEAWPSIITLDGFSPARVAPVGTGAALHSDSFDAPDGTSLTDHDPAYVVSGTPFEVRGGQVRLTEAQGIGTVVTDVDTADHEVAADVTLPENSDGFTCGVIARYMDGGTYLAARYLNQGAGESPEIELIERLDGVTTVVAFVNLGSGAIPELSTHTLRLAVRGGEAAVYHDEELVLQYPTKVLTGTMGGIGRDGTPTSTVSPAWDNLIIRAT